MSTMDDERLEVFLESTDRDKKDQNHASFQRYCREVRVRLQQYLQEYKICENVDAAVKYLISKPLLLAGVVAVIFAIGLPIVFFTLFAVTTIACTFTGFIFVEGTILVFGTVVLCGLLLSLIVSILALMTCIASAYYICLQICTVIKKT